MKSFLTTEKDSPFVSVVVPVYNDEGRIGKCIEALIRQTYPSRRYEILIIDNGSTDDTPSVIKKYPVRMLVESEIRSSYGARNIGIRCAQGEIIVFTDSDCIPAVDWIEKGVANLLGEKNCGIVGGRINIFFKNRGKPNVIELYDSIMGFNQKIDIERHHFGSTANVFTFRRIFDDIGFFNETLKSGGDNEWGRRVHSAGYAQIYADDACVAHPARNSLKQLYMRITRLAGGNYDQRRNNLNFVKSWIKSLRYSVGLMIRTILGLYPTETLVGATQRAQFLLAVVVVNLVTNYEKCRLLLGGRSKR